MRRKTERRLAELFRRLKYRISPINVVVGEVTRSYGADLHVRLKKAAGERLKKCRDTLFGHRAP
jgi:hypothetical protein